MPAPAAREEVLSSMTVHTLVAAPVMPTYTRKESGGGAPLMSALSYAYVFAFRHVICPARTARP